MKTTGSGKYNGNYRSLRVIALLLFCTATFSANAHFLLNLNVRILHVEHLSDGIRVYLRLPMPYLVAEKVGPIGENDLPEPAPYTSNRLEDEKLVHYVDIARFNDKPAGLGEFAAEGFQFVVDGKRLEAAIKQVRIHRVGTQPGYATLDEARAVFVEAKHILNDRKTLYVGDAVVDVILRYTIGQPIYEYSVSSTLDPGLPGQENTANLILDYSPEGTKVFRARGLLVEPVEISNSPFSAIATFIKEGIRHILSGLDHVLFVLCLVLGATRLNNLIWRITGFTIGHSVSLSAGFFGFVPSGAWFVPMVETGIALSIIYAAAIALVPRSRRGGGERKILLVTSLIGILHGLGFSFVLHKILQVDSPDIWQSLLAFNVGVEFGQLAVILAAWPAFRLIRNSSENVWRVARFGIAAICIIMAAMWVWQRSAQVIGTF